LIKSQDAAGILAVLSCEEVEAQLLDSVLEKAAACVQQKRGSAPAGAWRVDPEAIVSVYRDCVIPYTKEIQVQYLLKRLGTVRAPPRCAPGLLSGCHQHDFWGWPSTDKATATDNMTAKDVLAQAGVRVPKGDLLIKGEKELPASVQVPFVVKPCGGDDKASQWIALAQNQEDVDAAIEYGFTFGPRVIVEEYVAGREILTACIEMQDGTLRVLPKSERRLTEEAPKDRQRPAELNPVLDAQIDQMVMTAHRALRCHHYSLYHIRVDADDQPCIIEASFSSSKTSSEKAQHGCKLHATKYSSCSTTNDSLDQLADSDSADTQSEDNESDEELIPA
jgi:hypothetical protein